MRYSPEQFEPLGQGICGEGFAAFIHFAHGLPGGLQQHQAEDDAEITRRYARSEVSPENRANGGRDFEEHSDAYVGVAVAHISGGRAGRGGDDGDQAGADGIAQIDA